MSKLEVDRTRSGGNGRSSKIHWVAQSDTPLSEQDIRDLQIKEGYHPGGYGIHNIKIERTPEGKYKATWFCWGSCD